MKPRNLIGRQIKDLFFFCTTNHSVHVIVNFGFNCWWENPVNFYDCEFVKVSTKETDY